MNHLSPQLLLASISISLLLGSNSIVAGELPGPVSAPPEHFFNLVPSKHRAKAHEFYKKHIDVAGMPVVAAGEVEDSALQRTHWIVTHLLAGRKDVLEAMV